MLFPGVGSEYNKYFRTIDRLVICGFVLLRYPFLALATSPASDDDGMSRGFAEGFRHCSLSLSNRVNVDEA